MEGIAERPLNIGFQTRIDLWDEESLDLLGRAHCISMECGIESITEALGTAKVPDDFRFSMVNPPGANAYPIAGATWLLVYEQQKDAEKGKKLVEFLNWALAKGEQMAASLDYAPLPANLQQRVSERVKTIKY